MAHDDSHLGELESTLKQHATQLVDSLEKGRFGEAVGLIHELNKARDHGLYQEIGKLTRELHNAIVNFQVDPHNPHAQEISQISDATERLSYVVQMTEKAANRTMDLVEQSAPLVNDLGDGPREMLGKRGLRPVVMAGFIERGLEAVYAGKDLIGLQGRQRKCSSKGACAGGGGGCG